MQGGESMNNRDTPKMRIILKTLEYVFFIFAGALGGYLGSVLTGDYRPRLLLMTMLGGALGGALAVFVKDLERRHGQARDEPDG
jgi:hypothetical protein